MMKCCYKFPDLPHIEMLEYQLRQKERLKNRDNILSELVQLKDKELKKHKQIVKTDIRENVLKSIKRHRGRNKGFTKGISSPPSPHLYSSVNNFINNEVHGNGYSSSTLYDSGGDDGSNLSSAISNALRGIDFLGILRQLYNAALPVLNIGTRLGLGIGVDVFDEIGDSHVPPHSLAIQHQALSRSDFVPELEHWFRRTIWFLGFSAIWTLSPSLAIITVNKNNN